MAADADRMEELEGEVARLMEEVDRYRTAAEDALGQLDWCIGYFSGSHKSAVARALSGNRAHIRRHLMKRADQSMPAATGGGAQSSG
jgi:hypothetical protein